MLLTDSSNFWLLPPHILDDFLDFTDDTYPDIELELRGLNTSDSIQITNLSESFKSALMFWLLTQRCRLSDVQKESLSSTIIQHLADINAHQYRGLSLPTMALATDNEPIYHKMLKANGEPVLEQTILLKRLAQFLMLKKGTEGYDDVIIEHIVKELVSGHCSGLVWDYLVSAKSHTTLPFRDKMNQLSSWDGDGTTLSSDQDRLFSEMAQVMFFAHQAGSFKRSNSSVKTMRQDSPLVGTWLSPEITPLVTSADTKEPLSMVEAASLIRSKATDSTLIYLQSTLGESEEKHAIGMQVIKNKDGTTQYEVYDPNAFLGPKHFDTIEGAMEFVQIQTKSASVKIRLFEPLKYEYQPLSEKSMDTSALLAMLDTLTQTSSLEMKGSNTTSPLYLQYKQGEWHMSMNMDGELKQWTFSNTSALHATIQSVVAEPISIIEHQLNLSARSEQQLKSLDESLLLEALHVAFATNNSIMLNAVKAELEEKNGFEHGIIREGSMAGTSYFNMAVSTYDADFVRWISSMVSPKPDLEQLDPNFEDRNSLRIAIDRLNSPMLATLFEHGLNVDYQLTNEQNGELYAFTLLQFALLNENMDVIETLLNAGADPNLDMHSPDLHQSTFLVVIESQRPLEQKLAVLDALVEHGLDIKKHCTKLNGEKLPTLLVLLNRPNQSEKSVLAYLDFFRTHGFDFNQSYTEDGIKEGPFSSMLALQSPAIFQKLIDCGCDVNEPIFIDQVTLKGEPITQTPLALAIEYYLENPEVGEALIDSLIQKGVDLNASIFAPMQTTALQYALSEGAKLLAMKFAKLQKPAFANLIDMAAPLDVVKSLLSQEITSIDAKQMPKAVEHVFEQEQWAASTKVDWISYFIGQGLALNAPMMLEGESTSVLTLMLQSNMDMVSKLILLEGMLQKGLNLSDELAPGMAQTWVQCAAREKSMALLKTLYQHGLDPNTPIESIHLPLPKGAALDDEAPLLLPPLMFAILKGDEPLLNELIQRGANPNEVVKEGPYQGYNAISLAAHRQDAETLTTMIQHGLIGADTLLEAGDHQGKTLRAWATEMLNEESKPQSSYQFGGSAFQSDWLSLIRTMDNQDKLSPKVDEPRPGR